MTWLREQRSLLVVVFEYVASKKNLADIFTKILAEPHFCALRDSLLHYIGVLPRGEC